MEEVVDTNNKIYIPPDISYDEKKLELHKLDSLTLLLYTFLLTLTVVTIWLFKHRYRKNKKIQYKDS